MFQGALAVFNSILLLLLNGGQIGFMSIGNQEKLMVISQDASPAIRINTNFATILVATSQSLTRLCRLEPFFIRANAPCQRYQIIRRHLKQ